MTDLFIAGNVSKTTSLPQDLVVDSVVDLVDMIEVQDSVEEMIGPEKCLTQNAAIVEMIVKYRSDQKMTDLFIAGNVSKTTNKVERIVLSDFQNPLLLS